MAKTGYNESELPENTNKTCSHLLPEEREIILIMDDRDRKWKASCSSPTYMKSLRNKAGNVQELNIIKMELFAQNSMKHLVNQFLLANMSVQSE